MGNAQSRTYFKLHNVVPPLNKSSSDNPLTGWLDKSTKPFASEEDRKQFIYATITVISQNGAIDLQNHDFRLLYSRRDDDRLVARLVAEKEGVIKTQIVPPNDGKNQIEAFLALRRHIERELDSLLSGLPSASVSGNPPPVEERKASATKSQGSSSNQSRQPETSPTMDSRNRSGPIALPNDAPPAYGKAVKEWQSGEKKG